MKRRLFVVQGILLVGFLGGRPAPSEEVRPPDLQTVQNALGIPVPLAHVSDANWIPSPTFPDFILIQDVHRHPQVQAQISELILRGYDSWGVKKVFLEGAFTPLDLSVFHRVPTKTRELLMQRLIKEGSLSGPELAAVRIMEREWRDPPVSPFQLFGMEDPELYRKNVQAYQEVLMRRGQAMEDLLSVRRLQTSMHLPQPNELDTQLGRLEALLQLKLTPTEYAAYLRGKAAIPSTTALKPAIIAAENYYQIAQERSAVFLKQASRRVPASTAPRIIVVGGFHTADMASLLRQQGRSFVVLRPAVGYADDSPLYEQRMKETAAVLAEAITPSSH